MLRLAIDQQTCPYSTGSPTFRRSSRSETDRELRFLLRLFFLAMTVCGVVVGLARRTHRAILLAVRLRADF